MEIKNNKNLVVDPLRFNVRFNNIENVDKNYDIEYLNNNNFNNNNFNNNNTNNNLNFDVKNKENKKKIINIKIIENIKNMKNSLDFDDVLCTG
jgi:hypothetical protein